MQRLLAPVLTVAVAVFLTQACAQSETVINDSIGTQYQTVRLVEVVGDLEHPWAVAFLPDESMLVTERPGRLLHVQDGEPTELSGVPEVVSIGQGGMMEVAVHPDYEENGWVYLTYSEGSSDATATTLARGRIDGDAFTDVEVLFQQDRHSSPGRHYGSKLAFMDDGTLLMSIGERGADPPRAQDLGDHGGSVLRLNDDGTPAEGNPFVGVDYAHDEIYSYGNRNIQGLAIDRQTGVIWATEHGPRGGDELNVIEPGKNYGWPVISHGRQYGSEQQWGRGRVREGMEQPVWEFLPTLAPSGLAVVRGDQFPDWEGNLLAGGLASQQIQRVVVEGHSVVHIEALLVDEIGRIRDVRVGPDGNIYIVTDHGDGGVYRMEPA
ncbi:MAG: PQQ-dependent sugar dehydrogenase [Candidatus Hydrogenedentota bacterium]